MPASILLPGLTHRCGAFENVVPSMLVRLNTVPLFAGTATVAGGIE